jgi:hypothetical protein
MPFWVIRGRSGMLLCRPAHFRFARKLTSGANEKIARERPGAEVALAVPGGRWAVSLIRRGFIGLAAARSENLQYLINWHSGEAMADHDRHQLIQPAVFF